MDDISEYNDTQRNIKLLNELLSARLEIISGIIYGNYEDKVNIFVVVYNHTSSALIEECTREIRETVPEIEVVISRLIDCHDPSIVSPRLIYGLVNHGVEISDFGSDYFLIQSPDAYDVVKYNNDTIKQVRLEIAQLMQNQGTGIQQIYSKLRYILGTALSSLMIMRDLNETRTSRDNFWHELFSSEQVSAASNTHFHYLNSINYEGTEFNSKLYLTEDIQKTELAIREIYDILNIHTNESYGISFSIDGQ
ncbi:hypothetical protein ABGV42_00450 [Paenibacillus pabuli]